MLLIFASQFNEIAQHAVAGWPKPGAILLTVDDLSTKGWFINNNDSNNSTIVASGRQFPVAEISGLISLMPYIIDQELIRIEKSSRLYVAAEMTAFLYYLFTTLKCPIINKPSSYNLTGPNWRHEEWLRACQMVSLPIRPYHRYVSSKTNSTYNTIDDQLEIKKIIVLSNRIIVSHAQELNSKVLQLAALAGVQFLEIAFAQANGQIWFYSANCIPSMDNPHVVAALYEIFEN